MFQRLIVRLAPRSAVRALSIVAVATAACSSHDSVAKGATSADSIESLASHIVERISTSGDSSAGEVGVIARPNDSTLTFRGLGPITIGMSRAATEAALGESLPVRGNSSWKSCGYITSKRLPPNVHVMVESGSIARVDVDSGSHVAAEGVRVGDPENSVDVAFAGHVTSSPAKYGNGYTLTVRSASPADSALRLVFETKHGRVVRIRGGRVPSVNYVERCG